MKYLKSFNESIFEGMSDIKKITLSELGDLSFSWKEKKENLTASDVDHFRKLFSEVGYPVNLSTHGQNVFRTTLEVVTGQKDSWYFKKIVSDIHIYKYADEYFIVRFDYDQYMPEEIFLCDQMSGVESFVEYLKSEIIKRLTPNMRSKSFESIESGDLYDVVRTGSSPKLGPQESVTNRDRAEIKKITEDFIKDLPKWKIDFGPTSTSIEIDMEGGGISISMFITKHADEYFHINTWTEKRGRGEGQNFTCDQLDGLKQIFNQIKKNIEGLL